jgi:hypothetical protein
MGQLCLLVIDEFIVCTMDVRYADGRNSFPLAVARDSKIQQLLAEVATYFVVPAGTHYAIIPLPTPPVPPVAVDSPAPIPSAQVPNDPAVVEDSPAPRLPQYLHVAPRPPALPQVHSSLAEQAVAHRLSIGGVWGKDNEYRCEINGSEFYHEIMLMEFRFSMLISIPSFVSADSGLNYGAVSDPKNYMFQEADSISAFPDSSAILLPLLPI